MEKKIKRTVICFKNRIQLAAVFINFSLRELVFLISLSAVLDRLHTAWIRVLAAKRNMFTFTKADQQKIFWWRNSSL